MRQDKSDSRIRTGIDHGAAVPLTLSRSGRSALRLKGQLVATHGGAKDDGYPTIRLFQRWPKGFGIAVERPLGDEMVAEAETVADIDAAFEWLEQRCNIADPQPPDNAARKSKANDAAKAYRQHRPPNGLGEGEGTIAQPVLEHPAFATGAATAADALWSHAIWAERRHRFAVLAGAAMDEWDRMHRESPR